ncbi:MAG TPA: glycosyltransferase family 9 protein, partial [Candidatus Krumholzibacteria bacterium]|nr:glycosyltransferase family 9 protein [Candidatus Krumholzibacteria bacterium]
VVLSLAMVDALRDTHPEIEIDYLSREPAASLLRPDARFARVLAWHDGPRASLSMVAALRSRRYRAAIDLYSNPRSAWLTWLSGAPVRIGGNRRGRRLLYTHRVQPAAGTPVIDVFMQYAAPLGVQGPAQKPVLVITAAESEAAEAHLENAGAPAGASPRIGVHPGGKWPVKRWPAAHFAALIDMITARGARPVLFTGPDEREATDEVRRLVRTSPARFEALDIRTTAAIISRLDAMVACDGGIMHTAVAVGTPTAGIFGSSQSSVWFPYPAFGAYRAAEIDVPCRPCHQHVCPLGHTRCLNELAPARVAELVQSLARTHTRLAT